MAQGGGHAEIDLPFPHGEDPSRDSWEGLEDKPLPHT